MPLQPFSDNWTYLKVELNWLERLLLLAVTRQRKETKEIDRVAQTRLDRVTSHWWKGIVSLEGLVAYDSPVERRKADSSEEATPRGSYHQQIEARIRTSQQQGVVLALPALCDRLNLSSFEKNLILTALAPEVHRRYAHLYEYLQGRDQSAAVSYSAAVRTDLPSIDLALRLFCRNDGEWRTARSSLTSSSPLIQHQLVELVFEQEAPLLSRLIKLSDPLVNFLLSDRPDLTQMNHLLSEDTNRNFSAGLPPLKPQTSKLKTQTSCSSFADLVLPKPLVETLQHLCQQVQFCQQVDEEWGSKKPLPGMIALFVGAAGTGKTLAAQTIAHTLNVPLLSADLAELNSIDQAELLQEISAQTPTVLLIKSAQIWLGRRSRLSETEIYQFLKQRQASCGLTLFSVERLPAMQQAWRSQLQSILQFPLPDKNARSRLWKQAFPPQVVLDDDIDWELLASQFALTGADIQAVARSAAVCAIVESSDRLAMRHLMQALKQKS